MTDEQLAQLTQMIANGQEEHALELARERGISDVVDLTNLVFFARHPEMDGRQIAAHEADLAQEWIEIRDEIVRPSLGLASSGEAE